MAGGAWLAPPGSAQYRRLCSAGPSGRSGVPKVLADTTSATPDPSAGVVMASPKVAIVTGGLGGHGLLAQVEGGGRDALGSVCAHGGPMRQRTWALFSAFAGFADIFAAVLST